LLRGFVILINMDIGYNVDVDYQTAVDLAKVKINQLKMIFDQGYKLSDKEEGYLGVRPTDFADTYLPFCEQHNISYRQALNASNRKINGDGSIYIGYLSVKKRKNAITGKREISIAKIREFYKDLSRYKTRRGIIISNVPIGRHGLELIATKTGYDVQTFLVSELMYNVTEHVFVPRHTVLNEEESRLFIENNKDKIADIELLPKILTSDPVAKYYNMKPGQIVRIERKQLYPSLIEKTEAYRLVIFG